MGKKQPVAFMSYVRFDDKHENGRLTEFRERLSAEVKMQTGDEFPIFQDREDIKWGQTWKERLEETIDDVTFLIPILTPTFFKSSHCREELEQFIEREKELGRNDLILPVYYVSSKPLDDEKKRAIDELAVILASRQLMDWRDLRFEPLTTPEVGKRMAKFALQICDALERVQEKKKVKKPPERKRKVSEASEQEVSEPAREMGEATRKLIARTEPPTLVVDQMHRGDHTTITEAINAAEPGDRILVRPGLYKEGLLIDKPIEIIGDGDLSDIIIEVRGKNVLLFKTDMGKVTNLTLRQMEGEKYYGVDIAQGRLELEGCDITSDSLSCIGIRGGADPRLRRNRIHDGKQSGIFIFENGQGTIEDNDIFGNTLAGVAIKEGGNPTLRRNRIHDGKASGVFIYENGQGTIEDNDIFGNTLSGVEIQEGGNPTLRRNRIHDGKQVGVLIWWNGQGTIEDNDIFGNARSGVEIKKGGNPILRRNRIHNGKQVGVFIWENGQGTIEDNDIFGNAFSGVEIKKGRNPTLRCNRINKNGYKAIWIKDGGSGVFEDNDLRDNAKGAWDISDDSKPNVKRAGNIE